MKNYDKKEYPIPMDPNITGSASPSPSPTPPPEPKKEIVKDYFPIKENVKYVYEGKGNEYASFEVYVDYVAQNKIQLRKSTGGTVLAEVIEVGEDKITRVFSKEEAYYRENFLDKTGEKKDVLLMAPIKKGTKWNLDEKRVSSITNTNVGVTTPYGYFQAVEVTTIGDTGNTVNYYAKDIGLIKSMFVAGDTEITSSLSKVEENATFETNLNFFYPSGTDDKIYYKNKKLSFRTNDDAKQIIEAAYKEGIGKGTGQVLTQNTKINKLMLEKEGLVNIDLNSAFASEMNAGAMFEGLILQSLTNTIGQFYNVDKVKVTIDGKPYQSGHILMGAEDYFHTKYQGVVEVK